MNLVEVEEELQHMCIASRVNKRDHALIRFILSTFPSYEEIVNVTKRDIKRKNSIFYVLLKKARRVRKAPIDPRTYSLLSEISKNLAKDERIFSLSLKEIDDIIKKYSFPNKNYNLEKVVYAVREIIKDCLFYSEEVIKNIKDDLQKIYEFLCDAHPLFSGMWDLEDEEVAKDYFEMLSKRLGKRSPEILSKISNVDVKFIRKILNDS